MFKNMNEAIQKGIKDYNELPLAFASIDDAIKYRVADFIWQEIRDKDTSEPEKVLKAIYKICK